MTPFAGDPFRGLQAVGGRPRGMPRGADQLHTGEKYLYPAVAAKQPGLTARFVIVPLACASLLTGLVQSLGTPWGLFRHYWVLVKLLLTVFATIVLLVKMELIGYAARLAAETTLPRTDLREAGIQLVVHAAGGLLVLFVPA